MGLPGQMYGISKHMTHFRDIEKTSVCLKTNSQVFLGGFSTCEMSGNVWSQLSSYLCPVFLPSVCILQGCKLILKAQIFRKTELL